MDESGAVTTADKQHTGKGKRQPKPITARSQRWNGAIMGSLRVLLVLFLVDMLVQVVLAGLFITGDVALLKWHDNNANILLSSILFFALIPALLLWRPARGTSGPVWWILVLFLLIEAQKTLGYLRLIAWHIPVGVAIFGISVGLVVWAYLHKHDAYARAERIARKKERK